MIQTAANHRAPAEVVLLTAALVQVGPEAIHIHNSFPAHVELLMRGGAQWEAHRLLIIRDLVSADVLLCRAIVKTNHCLSWI